MKIIYLKLKLAPVSYSLCLVLLIGILSGCDQLDGETPGLINGNGYEAAFIEQNAPLVTVSKGTPIEGQYIIVFKENAIQSNEMSRLAGSNFDRSMMRETLKQVEQFDAAFNKEVKNVLSSLKVAPGQIRKTISTGGFQAAVVNLDGRSMNNILKDPRVDFVEQDMLMAMSFVDPNTRRPMIPSSESYDTVQVSPYGVNRVGGSVNKSGASAVAWVVDTGIDLDHVDLNVHKKYSRNFVASEVSTNYSGNDVLGHGTHVAGIIGALDNGIGTKGVAPGVQLVSVKVIDDKGAGTISDLLDGLEWVEKLGKPGDVVNVSLGGASSKSIDNAVKKVAKKGIIVVIAAGNGAEDAINISPARLNEAFVYTISAIDELDNFCSFSNYGGSVDFAAPGSKILSTFPNDQYAYASGTSMAAPHAAGVLLITQTPHGKGNAKGDPDAGLGDPIIAH